MPNTNYNEVEQLKARIKILEEENSLLSENKEELLLLGLISEQVVVEKDESTLLSTVLEKISILKDVPFCASFSLNSKTAQLVSSYSALQNTEIRDEQIQISEKFMSQLDEGATIIDLEQNQEFCLIQNTEIPFNAKTAILVPFSCRFISKGLFLFLFERQSRKELSSIFVLLLRVVEIAVSKIENISLVRELQTMNIQLDSIVKEKTHELNETNESLKTQIEEQKKIKAQFHQSQKMEAIGKLAGGIAHDFNNLLTVINGFSELLLIKATQDSPGYTELKEINSAGKRATHLTSQLLAFSRKQIIKPIIVNLNNIVANAEKMLQRLIGEHINLQTILEPGLGTIKADPGQIDQILLNLAINARDAMLKGGNLTIRTQTINITNADTHMEEEIKPGAYSCLSLTDTGTGMDEDVQEQVFEPFFTTKDIGEGTGLGLSTVFGIVRQNKGFIQIESSPGKGSTFHVYLPCVVDSLSNPATDDSESFKLNVKGSILVVEDDLGVQKLAVRVLDEIGYTIHIADNASSAMQILGDKSVIVDLLLTDVIMPGLSGKDLARQAVELRPDLKVLYMSGYTNDIIAKHGILAEEIDFIQKPFSPHSLIKSINKVLDDPK